ncbi:type III-A CRISPR-associated RAMP protein Csm3 [uncultured Leptotrichia sp.]|uniref:type III-A CRISPR-associated RAMP protein Csm3 n=1 Tax=uncultured Leptotrichia sp. TaxID=159271 RepID=UPI00260BD577|nr:type III-A CRISPR-associated RAMP protein Csm3 [uncultured Leptotrichia sp.]
MNTLKGKFIITGKIKVLTGLHIGTSGDFSAIGAVDNIVIRDAVTNKPIIPGSSLKGKMRYLLSRAKYNSTLTMPNIKKESDDIKRLFGASEPVVLSRLQFCDMLLREKDYGRDVEFDLPYTEIKYENTIDRGTGIANPRQQERVPAGSEFDFRLIYNIENTENMEEEVKCDFENILLMFELLEDDYLGGHGTRGYGRVKFEDLKLIEKVYIKENEDDIEYLKSEIENIENYTEIFGK